ncbi:MAG: DinB family protein [Ignavibacteria bacterium]|nr:DinB family protein [Ignavibacteria bacterium]
MKQSDIKSMPEYFDRYIKYVEDIELTDALSNYGVNLFLPYMKKLAETGNKTYAPDKWTVKNILQHLIDSERVFCYRALRFARNDKTELPGYDENKFAGESMADSRTIEDFLQEMDSVRKSSIDLFRSFNDKMLMRDGICFNKNISVLATGFVIAGHTFHHFNFINEKYLIL